MSRLASFNRLFLVFVLLSLLSAGSSFIQADGGANHRVRNLHFGVSGGNVKDRTRAFCCSGTLGSLVTDGTTKYILSNNHVLGLSGRASAGDDISQPGMIDSSCQVATVVADFTVAPPLNQNVDCAIAQLRSGQMDETGFIEDIGTISSVVKTPAVGLPVAKSGRTTGFTTATVGSINATVSVRYPKQCGSGGGSTFTFTNQVVVNSSSFSAGGDSGSLIVTNDSCNQPVALLFAGSSTSTIGNPIGQVLQRLSSSLGRTVSFVGDSCATSAGFEVVQDREPMLPTEAVERATRIKERFESSIMSRASVIGIGVGASLANPTDAAIVVYVDETRAKRPKLPSSLRGIPVRVVYTEPFVAF